MHHLHGIKKLMIRSDCIPTLRTLYHRQTRNFHSFLVHSVHHVIACAGSWCFKLQINQAQLCTSNTKGGSDLRAECIHLFGPVELQDSSRPMHGNRQTAAAAAVGGIRSLRCC
jgi:hypothetical protein